MLHEDSPVSVRMPTEVVRAIDAAAAREGISRAAFIRRAAMTDARRSLKAMSKERQADAV